MYKYKTILITVWFVKKKNDNRKQGIPWDPVVRTLGFHGRGHRFNPWLGELRYHKLWKGQKISQNQKQQTNQKQLKKLSNKEMDECKVVEATKINNLHASTPLELKTQY